MNQLPAGMYRQTDSVIQRLDATIKLIAFIILIAAVVFTDTPAGFLVIAVFVLLIIVISKIGVKTAVSGIHRMLWFFAVIFFMNFCFYKADNAWMAWWIFTPSYEGMMQGLKVVIRVAVFLILSNILSSTVPPVEITRTIENILSPLKVMKFPVEQTALIISVAIQFIPTLSEESDMIKKAQTARGARFDSSSLRNRAAAVLPMIVPMFIAAFRRADELSLAMEARGYRVDAKNRKRNSVSFGTPEMISLALCTAMCILQIIV